MLNTLATDLDGTLIPLGGNRQNESDLKTLESQLRQTEVKLVFVTGRHLESVSNAMEQFQLPQPHWLICDVGTSIYELGASGSFTSVEAYQQYQDEIIAGLPIAEMRKQLQSVEGLHLQEVEKQGRFKLSYYTDARRLDELSRTVQGVLEHTDAPYSLIRSVDPFNGDGLIDLLPATVSKAGALEWWLEHTRTNSDAVVFAGDSGNDLAAFSAGYRSIVVANADRHLAQQVYRAHCENGWRGRLHFSRGQATSGVLEGCHWFGLLKPSVSPAAIQQLGATPVNSHETHFRVWAPRRRTVSVETRDAVVTTRHALQRQESGYFCGCVTGACPGTLYKYVLDDSEARPDPASRFQPDGVHGASRIVDQDVFPWTDQAWKGVPKDELIIYELHVGTFTQDGTFRSTIERLPELLDLGITAIELMPVAQSPGRWNWGYDGVDLFAVRNTYGEPEDFKAFIDACHGHGIAVILDVVYNHLGPEGNYLGDFGPYFSRKHGTPWGEAFNFDGRHSKHVRQFIVENVKCWLSEYHLDGLRLDAVHFMLDDSKPTILDEIRIAVTKLGEGTYRALHLIAEANVYDRDLLTSEEGREPYDAIWCDCLMHSFYSHAVPGLQLANREYLGVRDLEEAIRHGYLYAFTDHQPVRVSAEQRHQVHHGEHGEPQIASFVTALQTHDGVGNHPSGKRIHHLTSRHFQRAAAALTLLYPGIPLIFMGEESASTSPFPFFADFEDPQLRKAVDEGRSREYPQHIWQGVLSPSDAEAFYCAKCDDADNRDIDMIAWYRDLIHLRKTGIAAGWLCSQRMSSEFNSDLDLFTMQFACSDGGAIRIRARLADASKAGAEPVAVATSGDILLSSETRSANQHDHILLQPNHAVITRCYKQQ